MMNQARTLGAAAAGRKSFRTHMVRMSGFLLELRFTPDVEAETSFAFEEVLLHEPGHVLDHEHGRSSRQDWRDAVAASGQHVSRYA